MSGNLVKLKFNRYDEDDFFRHVVTFEVPENWLMDYWGLESDEALTEFLAEYNSDDSISIYESALIDDVIEREFAMTGLESEIIGRFKTKTDECFHKVGKGPMSASEIEEVVLDLVRGKLEKEGLSKEDISLGEIALCGSRCRGFEKEDSDIDLVLAFESDTWREDSLFDLLNEEEWFVSGYRVDINPITEGKSGRLADYLIGAEKYLAEKEEIENKKLLDRAGELSMIYGNYAFVFGDVVSLPAEFEDEFSDHELKRLEELIAKQSAMKMENSFENKRQKLDKVIADNKVTKQKNNAAIAGQPKKEKDIEL